MAPVDIKNNKQHRHFLSFTKDFTSDKEVTFRLNIPNISYLTSQAKLEILENLYKIGDLYLWLANRFTAFVDAERVTAQMDVITSEISAILATIDDTLRPNINLRRKVMSPAPKLRRKRGSKKFSAR